MRARLLKSTLALAALAGTLVLTPAYMAGAVDNPQNKALEVGRDRAKVYRISRPAATVIVGDPEVLVATIQDLQTLVLTGKAFGTTNLIILDAEGEPIIDETVVVKSPEIATVRIYRQGKEEVLACAPTCRVTKSEVTTTSGTTNN